MTVSRKTLSVIYALIALLALVTTWGNILGDVGRLGFWQGTLQFWQDVLVNGSSRFITMDTLFLGLAVVLWMVLEARRLNLPGVWLYILAGLFIAISVAVPLFLLHRERHLARTEPASPGGRLNTADIAGLVLLAAGFIAFGGFTLSH